MIPTILGSEHPTRADREVTRYRQIGTRAQYLQTGATGRPQPGRESADQVHVASLMVGRVLQFNLPRPGSGDVPSSIPHPPMGLCRCGRRYRAPQHRPTQSPPLPSTPQLDSITAYGHPRHFCILHPLLPRSKGCRMQKY